MSIEKSLSFTFKISLLWMELWLATVSGLGSQGLVSWRGGKWAPNLLGTPALLSVMTPSTHSAWGSH